MIKKRFKAIRGFTLKRITDHEGNYSNNNYSMQFIFQDHKDNYYDIAVITDKNQCQSISNAINKEISEINQGIG